MLRLFPKGFLLKRKQKAFFKNEFIILLSVTGFFLLCVYSVLIYNAYENYQKTTRNKLEQAALRTDLALRGIFDENGLFMLYLGNQIASRNNPDLKFIYRFLKSASGNEYCTKQFLSKQFLSWSLFDWLSPDNLRLVNEKMGITTSSAPNMSYREHTWKCRKSPWTLQMSSPGVGNPSGLWVVPAGMGITNKEGKFLGIIVVGFNISTLTLYLEEHLKGEGVSFMILDESNRPIFYSSDNLFDDSDRQQQKEMGGVALGPDKSGLLKHSLSHNSLKYSYYYKMKEYPYVILTGLSTANINHGLYSTIFPRVIEFLFMIMFCFIILYIHHRKIIKATTSSDQARKDFMQKIIHQLQWHIDLIHQHSNVLLKFFKKEIDVSISKEKQIELVSGIQDAVLHLKQFPSNIVEKSYIDVQKAIQEATLIQSRNALTKKVLITHELEKNLPSFYANEVAFKQIIISLISQALENVSALGMINISTALTYDQSNKFLTIFVMDNGFGLSEDDLERISKKFNDEPLESIDGTSLSMPAILNLVKLHEGTCEISAARGKGRTVILKFPYLEEKITTSSPSAEKDKKKPFLKIVE